MTKKLLYSFWGYLSDKKGISSPDGNGTYSTWIIGEFIKRGWTVYCVIDRDWELVKLYGKKAFSAFSEDYRWDIYNKIEYIGIEGIDVVNFDLILHEWRMVTKDNSRELNDLLRTPDMDIQNKIINISKDKKIPLIIFDLDYKFTIQNEVEVNPWKVIEQGIRPKHNNISIFIPIYRPALHEFATQIPKVDMELVYIGNFYNREKDFNEKIIPYAKKHPNTVHLIGNYMKSELDSFRNDNKEIMFHERIGFDKFHELYSRSVVIPLLATEEYKKNGHMTARIIETLLFGGIPIGFSDFYGIEQWLPKELIVNMNNYENSMNEVMGYLKNLGFFQRIDLRRYLINKIGEKHDVVKFVDTILQGGNFG